MNILKKNRLIYSTNMFVKGIVQTKKIENQLAAYRLQAQKKNITEPSYEVLKQILAKRLNKRGFCADNHQKTLHFFLACKVVNWESALQKTLRSFGKITEFDWQKEGFNENKGNWLNKRVEMNKLMLEKFYQANNEQKIDVVIGYLSGHNTLRTTLEKIAETGTAIFNFCWDDKLSFLGTKYGQQYTGVAAIADLVDLNLTNSPDSIIKYMMYNGLALFWPEAAEPEIYKPYNIPYEFDVSFAGACYGNRPAFIRKLNKSGIKVECFGAGWPNGVLSNEKMVKLYSRSRINLGFSTVGYSKKIMCLKGRDFEVPMSGGFYLTENNPELSLVYDINKEIVTYKNIEDCVQKIKFFLNNPQKAEEISRAGRKKTLQNHTWEKRFRQLFELIGFKADF